MSEDPLQHLLRELEHEQRILAAFDRYVGACGLRLTVAQLTRAIDALDAIRQDLEASYSYSESEDRQKCRNRVIPSGN